MSEQSTPMNEFLRAIELERCAWDALQKSPEGSARDRQALYAAWAHAVSSASREAKRFLETNRDHPERHESTR